MDLKIFVMTDDDVRLARRLQRDISERGRNIENVLVQYNRFVKTSYDEFIKPTMKYADIIIPHGRSNTVAIDFVINNLKSKLPLDEMTFEEPSSPKKIEKQISEISSPTESPDKFDLLDHQNMIITNDVDPMSQLSKKSELLIQKILNNEEEILKDDYIN